MLLAIDTSTNVVSVALWRDGVLRAEHTWWSERNHTRELLPAVDALIRQVGGPHPRPLSQGGERGEGVRERDLAGVVDAVAVAIGPGSYSGLRVGVATAKGLALALGCPIVGVSTLAVQAYGCAVAAGPVWAVVAGGGREVAAACYAERDGRWTELVAPYLATPERLIGDLGQGDVQRRPTLCGELPPALVSLVGERLGSRVIVAPAGLNVRRAGWLAVLAADRLARGERDDVAQLEPIYLRRPSITPPREEPGAGGRERSTERGGEE
ncbi:MAG: tRNA (adenosine(37)-N6)-threonylcarbamoyltransferase complex dimerization subunit type 1 TsaB [Chloroflexi bacterium]|nr:tRNA (adenosine(37)-N6)-threonylcarbamoyltransferase complex dimerization subunit type 1 TsaB [Chloroflexota bacterium]